MQAEITLLYVGHISQGKNMHILTDVFKALCQSTDNVHLFVVGEGPYAKEMQTALKDTPCTFTGYLDGDELAAVYASCDIFVFPSATDTLGRAVLEAQASGLPVIVSDLGGPSENVIPGETGLIVKSNDSISLLHAVLTLVADPHRTRKMGQAARRYIEDRCFDTAFFETWPSRKNSVTPPPFTVVEAV